MAISFTMEQQKVIDLHDRNILVSAAAGSGKTAVLVERIIQMVCDEKHPVDIDRLLIVTFTNAAAAEMRERISLGINRQLALHPESEHIERQATLLHNAQITTIDSFCMFLLKNHFNEIGVDPAFRVMDEGEKKLLVRDVMDELLEEKFAEGREAALARRLDGTQDDTLSPFELCVEYFCPRGKEKVLEGYILSLYRLAESFPWPEEWLEERKRDYERGGAGAPGGAEAGGGAGAPGGVEADGGAGAPGGVSSGAEALTESGTSLGELDPGGFLVRHLRRMLEGCRETYRRFQALCQEPDGPYMYGDLADQELEQVERLLGLSALEEYAKWLPAMNFGRLSAKKDETVSASKRELAKKLRGEVKDVLTDLGKRFFSTPLDLAGKQAAECAAPVRTLVELALEFRKRLQERKRADKLVDFSDMEHYALDILLEREDGRVRPSQVALEYRQHFHEILIDEYQDSNLVQEYLLSAISGESQGHYNRFMVGDVKQSIYKFRLARPELFLEKYQNYTDGEGVCQKIDLSRNFRSRREVVDTVNGVFRGIMSTEIGGIAYDDKAALYAGADYPENAGCGSELLLVEKSEEYSARQTEALAIARRIKELLESFQVTDKETRALRPVRYRDIVILLRTNSGWDEEFKGILEEEGIPVYITSKTGYFAASEVQELLQLLRVLNNPRQEIPLFGVMKSIFGGFTEEEIALLRSRDKESSLIQVLEEVVGESIMISADLREKVRIFLDKIRRFREWTVYLPIRELLQRIVGETGYLPYVSALPAGSKRLANVEMLFTKASDFEKTSYHGLFHFIRYMEQLEKYDVDYGEAELLDENADVVRIMSIHKSKGLEFPVTFVSGLAKRFNTQDTNQSLIVDMDLGIGADYVDVRRRIRNKTLRRQVLAQKMREDNLSEELRVLYVALTRAREKLIMTAFLENAAQKWEEYRLLQKEHLSFPDFIGSASFLDFLLPVISQVPVNVQIVDMEGISRARGGEQLRLMEKRNRLRNSETYADAEALGKLRERFAWNYPLEALQKLYTKTTVSELKIAAMAEKDEEAFHAFEEQEIVPYIPRFKREEEETGGSVRGNAFHKVMELLNYAVLYRGIFAGLPNGEEEFLHPFQNMANQGNGVEGASSGLSRSEAYRLLYRNFRDFLDNEAASRRLGAGYGKLINEHKIVQFLASPLAFRMWRAQDAGTLHREQPFVLAVSAKRLNADFPEEEKVLIQGIIDAYFVEDGELVLVDYKTDVVHSPEELRNRYETQLQYYEETLCRLLRLPMKQKILYSFYLEQCC